MRTSFFNQFADIIEIFTPTNKLASYASLIGGIVLVAAKISFTWGLILSGCGLLGLYYNSKADKTWDVSSLETLKIDKVKLIKTFKDYPYRFAYAIEDTLFNKGLFNKLSEFLDIHDMSVSYAVGLVFYGYEYFKNSFNFLSETIGEDNLIETFKNNPWAFTFQGSHHADHQVFISCWLSTNI